MKNRALIAYGSLTGNTEMVAKAFAEVCRAYNLEPDLVKITANKNDSREFYTEDYDLVCLGSPIMQGLPYNAIVGTGASHIIRRDRTEGFKPETGADIPRPSGHPNTSQTVGTGAPGAKGEIADTVYGVVFVTYGGCGVGPKECEGSLGVMEEAQRMMGVRTIGKFACPGKELRHNTVDKLARKFGLKIDEVQDMVSRYKDNPQSEEFLKYSPEQIEALKKGAGEANEDSYSGQSMMGKNDPLGCGKPGSVYWHYDFMNRPNERDIEKAKIFLAEIIEDYFLTMDGKPRAPYSQYTSIS